MCVCVFVFVRADVFLSLQAKNHKLIETCCALLQFIAAASASDQKFTTVLVATGVVKRSIASSDDNATTIATMIGREMLDRSDEARNKKLHQQEGKHTKNSRCALQEG